MDFGEADSATPNVLKRHYASPGIDAAEQPEGAISQPVDAAKGMVTRARFERATPSFGGWCSIQLSYRATGGLS